MNIQMTVKNVQCMRALLNIAHCHGGILGTAWYMTLVTLQHLTQILGLKLSSGGSNKTIQANEIPNLVSKGHGRKSNLQECIFDNMALYFECQLGTVIHQLFGPTYWIRFKSKKKEYFSSIDNYLFIYSIILQKKKIIRLSEEPL